jgi:hypothetical protein
VDHVQVASTTGLDFDYVMQHAIQNGDNTEIAINGSVMVLQHVGLSNLTASDFFFDAVLA